MHKLTSLLLLLSLTFIISCSSDDDSYTALNIEINSENVSVDQNNTVEVFIFDNDSNIPTTGTITLTSPTKGTVVINDFNNTPSDPSDDSVIFSTSPNRTGEDTFNYTVCDDNNNCATGTVTVNIISISNVNYDLDNFPFQTLSEYNFFQGELKNLNPNYGVLPYKLNSKLFTDYAKKKRFVWIPTNSSASYEGDGELLTYPNGTVLIKNFYYENALPGNTTRIIETRLMIKKSGNWIFADYVWNADQTEASLDLNGSLVNVQWEQDGEMEDIQYRIPSQAECVTCHKITEVPFPIGTKPRNLNLTYDYGDGVENQIDKWTNFGYLENALPSSSISSVVDYEDLTAPLEERVRAYVDINCAHCHKDEGHCDYRPIRLDYESTDVYANFGVCVDPDEFVNPDLQHIVEPGDSRNSMLHFRLSSTDESYRMPLLGRSIVHQEGVELIEEWIDQLSESCD